MIHYTLYEVSRHWKLPTQWLYTQLSGQLKCIRNQTKSCLPNMWKSYEQKYGIKEKFWQNNKFNRRYAQVYRWPNIYHKNAKQIYYFAQMDKTINWQLWILYIRQQRHRYARHTYPRPFTRLASMKGPMLELY